MEREKEEEGGKGEKRKTEAVTTPIKIRVTDISKDRFSALSESAGQKQRRSTRRLKNLKQIGSLKNSMKLLTKKSEDVVSLGRTIQKLNDCSGDIDEIDELIGKVEELEEVDSMQDTIDTLESQIQEVDSLKDIVEELTSKSKKLDSMKGTIENWISEWNEADLLLWKPTKKELRSQSVEIDSIKDIIERLESQCEDIESFDEIVKELTSKSEELESLNETICELSRICPDVETIKDNLENLNNESDGLDSLNGAIIILKNELKTLDSLEGTITHQEEEIDDLDSQTIALKNKLLTMTNEKQHIIENMDEDLNLLKEVISNNKMIMETLNRSLDTLQKKNLELESKFSTMEIENIAYREKIVALDQQKQKEKESYNQVIFNIVEENKVLKEKLLAEQELKYSAVQSLENEKKDKENVIKELNEFWEEKLRCKTEEKDTLEGILALKMNQQNYEKEMLVEKNTSLEENLKAKIKEKDSLEGIISLKIKQINQQHQENEKLVEEKERLEENKTKLEDELKVKTLEKDSLEGVLSMKIKQINKQTLEQEEESKENKETLQNATDENTLLREQLKASQEQIHELNCRINNLLMAKECKNEIEVQNEGGDEENLDTRQHVTAETRELRETIKNLLQKNQWLEEHLNKLCLTEVKLESDATEYVEYDDLEVKTEVKLENQENEEN